MSNLTPRESQVLQLCAGGLSDKEIAAELGIAYQTARNHLHRVSREYGTNGRVQAVIHGIVAGDVVLHEAVQCVEARRGQQKRRTG